MEIQKQEGCFSEAFFITKCKNMSKVMKMVSDAINKQILLDVSWIDGRASCLHTLSLVQNSPPCRFLFDHRRKRNCDVERLSGTEPGQQQQTR